MFKKFVVCSAIFVGLFLLYSWKTVDIVIHQAPTVPLTTNMIAVGILPKHASQNIGDGSGVDIDSEGNIYFLHRAGFNFSNNQYIKNDVINIYSSSLKPIASWGAGIFKSPHGITIDNKDNVWITDIMQNKVFKLDKKGNVLSIYGQDYPMYLETCLKVRNKFKLLPCTMSTQTFARPTDVEVYDDGSFVVADGYRNSRIVKFSSNGNLVWEVQGIGNETSAFYLPHDLALDSTGNIYVADRRNSRIQVFSKNGEWRESWDHPDIGRPYAIDVAPDGFLYLVDAGDSYELPNGVKRSQLIKLSLDGVIVDRYSAFGSEVGEMDLPHDISVSTTGQIFVAEIKNQRLQVFSANVN